MKTNESSTPNTLNVDAGALSSTHPRSRAEPQTPAAQSAPAAVSTGLRMVPGVTRLEDPWENVRGPQAGTATVPRKQLNTRLPVAIHAELKRAAETQGMSLQQATELAIGEGLRVLKGLSQFFPKRTGRAQRIG